MKWLRFVFLLKLLPCDSVVHITAELGRALAVVKVTPQVNGNSQFLGSAPKNYWGDKDKIWHK